MWKWIKNKLGLNKKDLTDVQQQGKTVQGRHGPNMMIFDDEFQHTISEIQKEMALEALEEELDKGVWDDALRVIYDGTNKTNLEWTAEMNRVKHHPNSPNLLRDAVDAILRDRAELERLYEETSWEDQEKINISFRTKPKIEGRWTKKEKVGGPHEGGMTLEKMFKQELKRRGM